MKQSKKMVTIRWASVNHLLPSSMSNEITKTIGSKRARNGHDVLMGLTREERLILLPSVIGVDPTSQHWEKGVKTFFADLAIHVDHTGKELDITTYPERKQLNGKYIDIDMPENIMDYIMYKQCLVDKSVASSFEESKDGTFKYYIENKEQARQKEKQDFKFKQKIEQEFIRLTQIDDNNNYPNAREIKFVALVMGRNINFYDMDELVLQVEELKTRSIQQLKTGISFEDTDFIKIVKDPNLKDKAFILTLVDKSIVAKEGDYYVDADKRELVLGQSLEEAVSFIRNDINSQTVLSYKEKLKTLKEVAT